MSDQVVDRGKPAEYGQEIVKRRARITARFLSLANKLVLDFGAGNGAQTMELLPQGCTIVACDIDPGDLEVFQTYVAKNNVARVTPILYDGIRLPYPDAHFDVAVCYQVLEHVTDEESSLSEIRRVLKPSADLVISVPNKWWVFETHGARLPLLPWNRVPFFSWLPRIIHSRFARARIYTRNDIARVLEKSGFEVLRKGYMTAPMDMVKSPSIQKFLRKFVFRGDQSTIPFMATEVFVHSKKKNG